jgi:hypothetical protein
MGQGRIRIRFVVDHHEDVGVVVGQAEEVLCVRSELPGTTSPAFPREHSLKSLFKETTGNFEPNGRTGLIPLTEAEIQEATFRAMLPER